MTGAIGHKRIQPFFYERELIINPTISEQEDIIKELSILKKHSDTLILTYKEELKNLEELKKSILQKAFTGELTNKKTHHE